MYFDSSFVILLPALFLSFLAQMKINSTYNKYSEVFSVRGYTGAQVARMLLPVEFNASRRALIILEDRGILYTNEINGAREVLKAAAMTYVAATLMAISQLLRLLAISNRNRD